MSKWTKGDISTVLLTSFILGPFLLYGFEGIQSVLIGVLFLIGIPFSYKVLYIV